MLVLVSARSGFRGYADEPEHDWEVLEQQCRSSLDAALGTGYDALKAAHVRAHRRLVERVEIELDDGTEPSLTTDERVIALGAGVPDSSPFALYAQYARYLLISRSRPEAAEFVLDLLTEGQDGLLTTCPSTSPENSFVTADGELHAVSAGATLDLWLVRDLFRHCIEAAAILGADPEFVALVTAALGRLAPVPIGRDGRIDEWWRPFVEHEPGHRHLSHLWACTPATRSHFGRAPFWPPRLDARSRCASRTAPVRRVGALRGRPRWLRGSRTPTWHIAFWFAWSPRVLRPTCSTGAGRSTRSTRTSAAQRRSSRCSCKAMRSAS